MEISTIFPVQAPSGAEALGHAQAKAQDAQPVAERASARVKEVAERDSIAEISDEVRKEAVQKAAEVLQDIFVVSDVRFTIFKDRSGQYITRFTSLRDGSITYVPEPDMMQLHRFQPSAKAVVQTEA